jgi:hypothetical protein
VSIFLALFIGWAMERVQMVMCAHNYEAMWNGYGAIEITNRREAKAPMAYRVLVPWLIWLIEYIQKIIKVNIPRINYYQVIKIFLNAYVVWAVAQGWGLMVALMVAAIIPITFKYDYWDWTLELGGIALAMSGRLELAIAGGILAGLSRETAIAIPVAYLLKTYDITGAGYVLLAVAIPLITVRLLVGKRELYCSRWMIKENLAELKRFFKWVPWFQSEYFISMLIVGLTLSAVLITKPIGWPIPLMIVAAGLTMGRLEENRTMIVCLPWIAAWLLGGV